MSRRRERPYDDLPDEAEEARRKSRRREDSPDAARHQSRSRSRSPSGSPRRRSDESPPARSNRPSRRCSDSPRRSASPTRSSSPPPARQRGSDREQNGDRMQQRAGGGRDRETSGHDCGRQREASDREAAAVETDRGRDRNGEWQGDRADRGDRDRSDRGRERYGGDRDRSRERYGSERDRDRGRDRSPGSRGGDRDRRDGGSRYPARDYDSLGSRGQGRGGGRGKERWGYNAYLKEEGAGAEGDGEQQQEKRKGRGFAGRDAGRDARRSRSRSRGRGEGVEAAADGAAAGATDGDRQQEPAAAAATAGAAQNGAGGDDKEAAEFLQKKAAVSGRAGGAYIPPFRLARMMAEIDDKNSAAAQKLSWEALRKSLNGLINKVNAPNIKEILPELFGENLLRGRGLFCQALMKAQLASPAFTPLYAALVAVVNTKFPEIGELLLHRVIAQFKRAYKRNDKPITIAAAKFLAHLINQGVLHEVMALEMLILLLENPSDDSVEMAVDFCKEVGAHLQDVAPAGLHSVFERFRAILHEGAIDKRCQYMIEGLFAVRKAGFATSGHPAVRPELDLVEDEDQITHEMSLEDKHDPQAILNVFREDPEFAEHEAQYKAIARELLGDESEEGGEEEGEGGEGSSEEEESGSEGGGGGGGGADAGEIEDETGTDVVNLRRTIYLTIMSSLDFEEAGHKLMKIQLRPGQECEIPIMIIECCSQEKTFVRYYALLGSRFCMVRKEFQATFEDCFAKQYAIIHRLETNKLRNVAKLFAHLLANDAISWGVLQCIRLTEDDTTSSSRIFIKYLFQELSEYLGLVKLNERLAEPSLQEYFTGIFPQDTMQNMRFSINFFTSIGLGGITDRQRALYKEMPRIMAERKAANEAARKAARGGRSSSESGSGSSSSSGSGSSSSGSGSSSSSSGSGSDSSSSDSESEDSRDRRRRRKRTSSRDRRRR